MHDPGEKAILRQRVRMRSESFWARFRITQHKGLGYSTGKRIFGSDDHSIEATLNIRKLRTRPRDDHNIGRGWHPSWSSGI